MKEFRRLHEPQAMITTRKLGWVRQLAALHFVGALSDLHPSPRRCRRDA